jgi:uncharacterized secreted protein with C-terminal beta-propeller domain
MKFRIFASLLTLSCLFFSCKPDPLPEPKGEYAEGVFVTNEGLYNQSSGTISFYHPDSNLIQQEIFFKKNNRNLGNIVQSMTFVGDRAYIVVNNANKIEIADAETFEEKAQILNLEQPRYCLAIDTNKAYISQWGTDLLSGSIAVLDLNTNTISQTIRNLGKGAERMLFHNNKLYVTMVGGLETDHKIIVINTQTDQVEDSILVADAPNSLQLAADGSIWVACSGKAVYSSFPDIDTAASSYGALLRIDPATNTVSDRINLQKGKGASDLIRNEQGNSMYFSYDNKVYQFNPQTKQFQELIQANYYGMAYNNKDNTIYASEYAGIDAAWIYIHRAIDGQRVDSFKAGVFANNIYFK